MSCLLSRNQNPEPPRLHHRSDGRKAKAKAAARVSGCRPESLGVLGCYSVRKRSKATFGEDRSLSNWEPIGGERTIKMILEYNSQGGGSLFPRGYLAIFGGIFDHHNSSGVGVGVGSVAI